MTFAHSGAGDEPPCEACPGADTIFAELARTCLPTLPIIGWGAFRPASLVLRLDPLSRRDEEEFEILVADRVGATLLRLGPFPEEEVVAVWRGLGASSRLPLLIESVEGDREPAFAQFGALLLGPVRIRRRHSLLAARRPRFLMRRKTGRLPLRPQVFREPEMFSRST